MTAKLRNLSMEDEQPITDKIIDVSGKILIFLIKIKKY